jgi:hypothetical protein
MNFETTRTTVKFDFFFIYEVAVELPSVDTDGLGWAVLGPWRGIQPGFESEMVEA